MYIEPLIFAEPMIRVGMCAGAQPPGWACGRDRPGSLGRHVSHQPSASSVVQV